METIIWDRRKIKAARKAAGLTIVGVARRLGVHTQTIRSIECGDRHPSPKSVVGLAKIYGRPLPEFLLKEYTEVRKTEVGNAIQQDNDEEGNRADS